MRAAELTERLLARDRSAVSEALNLIDDARPSGREAAFELLDRLERASAASQSYGAARIGITGAPGAGKSTLLDALVRELRARDRTLGIIAVDPSSQRTGGALLGDRMRVRSSASDPGVFLRSMAARSRLGGLADATRAGVEVLGAVFDWVFVETVGVGQSESDVARLADTLVFVAQPGAGDLLQFMKAGLLELPDVFVVNKSDLGPLAERTAGELSAGLGLGERESAGGADWTPPVLLVSARESTGVAGLVDALEGHGKHLARDGGLQRTRQRARAAWIEETLARRYGSFGLERVGGWEAVRSRALAAGADDSAVALVRVLAREIEDALGKPGG